MQGNSPLKIFLESQEGIPVRFRSDSWLKRPGVYSPVYSPVYSFSFIGFPQQEMSPVQQAPSSHSSPHSFITCTSNPQSSQKRTWPFVISLQRILNHLILID